MHTVLFKLIEWPLSKRHTKYTNLANHIDIFTNLNNSKRFPKTDFFSSMIPIAVLKFRGLKFVCARAFFSFQTIIMSE